MATIDQERKRISAILLFYGPPGSGKTTSLYALSRILPPGTHGKVAPLVQGDGRMLRLDYRPHDQDLVYGYQVNFRLVTCTGPIDVDLLRPLLSAVDALMFVADSSPGSLQANAKAYDLLDRMLRGAQRSLEDVPLVFTYNKRDLRDAVDIRTLEARLNKQQASYVAASAVRGQGVLEALQKLTATVAVRLRQELQEVGGGSGTSNAATVAHGVTFQEAQAAQQGIGDDVTSIAGGAEEWEKLGDDDHTEVNPQELDEDWVAEAPPPPSGRRPPGPRSIDAFQSGSDRRGGPPARGPAFKQEPIYSTTSWRTPEAYTEDVDADDRTMPGQEMADMMAQAEQLQAPPQRQAVAAGGGGASRVSARAERARQPRQPRADPRRPPPPQQSARRAPPPPARARRVNPPSRSSVAAVASQRSVPAAGTSSRPRPPAPPPPGPATQSAAGPFAANQTQVINAMGRAPEDWEVQVLKDGHQMNIPVPDLAGYVVSRIGTATASSRRTVKMALRATHMDTLVPQDFVIEIDLRGGGGPGSAPAVSARKRPLETQGRSIPLGWVLTGIGVLVVLGFAAVLVSNALGM